MIRREVIGEAECPLMHRWTLLDVGFAKLLLHHFLPTQRDRDPHDHPRSFLTFVFRGSYDDIQPCVCGGSGLAPSGRALCPRCEGDRVGRTDRVRAPAVRFRRATHAHITVAGSRGAWSLVVMGPLRRKWGFIRDGRWWHFREYETRFGGSFRCGDA